MGQQVKLNGKRQPIGQRVVKANLKYLWNVVELPHKVIFFTPETK